MTAEQEAPGSSQTPVLIYKLHGMASQNNMIFVYVNFMFIVLNVCLLKNEGIIHLLH
jgi:hypothetical protein